MAGKDSFTYKFKLFELSKGMKNRKLIKWLHCLGMLVQVELLIMPRWSVFFAASLFVHG